MKMYKNIKNIFKINLILYTAYLINNNLLFNEYNITYPQT